MNKKAIWEAIKELARLAVFAVVAVVVTWATSKTNTLDPTSTQAVIITAVLRFVDKWVHENKDVEAKGLLPF